MAGSQPLRQEQPVLGTPKPYTVQRERLLT